jgi:hypothetical protein
MGKLERMAENIRFRCIKPTWGDREGIQLSDVQVVFLVCSLLVWLVPLSALPAWILLHGIASFCFFYDAKIYCDAQILWEGIKRLEGLSIKKAYKQAFLTSYLKFQNHFVSWLFARLKYDDWQIIFLIGNSLILIFLSIDNPFAVRLLLSTPYFLLLRSIPTHDSLYLNVLLLGLCNNLMSFFISLMLVLWLKFFTIGFKRINRKQLDAISSFVHYWDSSYMFDASWSMRIVRFFWIVFAWLPLLFCTWFFVGFLFAFVARVPQKYYIYLVPFVFFGL